MTTTTATPTIPAAVPTTSATTPIPATTPAVKPAQLPKAPIASTKADPIADSSVTTTDDTMNGLIVWYAIAAYAYNAAYLKTYADLQDSTSPNARGLFDTSTSVLTGMLGSEAKGAQQGKEVLLSSQNANAESMRNILAEMPEGQEKEKLVAGLTQQNVLEEAPEDAGSVV